MQRKRSTVAHRGITHIPKTQLHGTKANVPFKNEQQQQRQQQQTNAELAAALVAWSKQFPTCPQLDNATALKLVRGDELAELAKYLVTCVVPVSEVVHDVSRQSVIQSPIHSSNNTNAVDSVSASNDTDPALAQITQAIVEETEFERSVEQASRDSSRSAVLDLYADFLQETTKQLTDLKNQLERAPGIAPVDVSKLDEAYQLCQDYACYELSHGKDLDVDERFFDMAKALSCFPIPMLLEKFCASESEQRALLENLSRPADMKTVDSETEDHAEDFPDPLLQHGGVAEPCVETKIRSFTEELRSAFSEGRQRKKQAVDILAERVMDRHIQSCIDARSAAAETTTLLKETCSELGIKEISVEELEDSVVNPTSNHALQTIISAMPESVQAAASASVAEALCKKVTELAGEMNAEIAALDIIDTICKNATEELKKSRAELSELDKKIAEYSDELMLEREECQRLISGINFPSGEAPASTAQHQQSHSKVTSEISSKSDPQSPPYSKFAGEFSRMRAEANLLLQRIAARTASIDELNGDKGDDSQSQDKSQSTLSSIESPSGALATDSSSSLTEKGSIIFSPDGVGNPSHPQGILTNYFKAQRYEHRIKELLESNMRCLDSLDRSLVLNYQRCSSRIDVAACGSEASESSAASQLSLQMAEPFNDVKSVIGAGLSDFVQNAEKPVAQNSFNFAREMESMLNSVHQSAEKDQAFVKNLSAKLQQCNLAFKSDQQQDMKHQKEISELWIPVTKQIKESIGKINESVKLAETALEDWWTQPGLKTSFPLKEPRRSAITTESGDAEYEERLKTIEGGERRPLAEWMALVEYYESKQSH